MYKITILNFFNMPSANAAAAIQKVKLVQLLIVIAVLCSGSLFAQNGIATLGHAACSSCQPDASSLATVLSGVTPFPSGVQNQKSNYIYLANEITASPNLGGPGPITSISFYITELPYNKPYTFSNYNIKIGHTEMTHFNSLTTSPEGYDAGYEFDFPGAVITAVPTFTISQVGWYTITLAEPFHWNGSSNIIVEMCNSNSTLMHNGSNYQGRNIGVLATKYPGSAGMLSRSWYTFNPGANQPHPVAGCDMNGSGSTHSSQNFSAMTTVAKQRTRPDVRFQFGCTGTPTAGVADIVVSPAGKGCAELTLGVPNGAQQSGLEYKWLVADNADMHSAVEVVNGTTATLKTTHQPADKWYARRTTCEGLSVTSGAKKIASAPANTFENGNWTLGVPTEDSTNKLVVNNSTIISANARACGCEVKAGASVVVESGTTLTIDSDIKVAQGGSLTFKEGASLIQKNRVAVNTGKITYERASQPLLRYDFTYWSSPVKNQKLIDFSPNTLGDKFMSFNPVTQAWVIENNTNTMVAGKGYIIRAPQAFNITGTQSVYEATFTGTPNNGDVTVPISTGTGKFNLIGNPYPSAVDAAAFYAANSSKLDGTFYFWTHGTPVTNMSYSSTDYAVMTLFGSVAAAPGEQSSHGMIGAGQSFMVKGKPGSAVGNETVKFTNDMRRGAVQNAVFYRGSAAPGPIAQDINEQKHRLWLDLRNGQGYKQILVGYTATATVGYDAGIDGEAIAGPVVSFYSLQDAQQLAIQGRPTFNVADQVPLGFSTTMAGNQTISLSNYDGLFSTQNVLLEDKLLNVVHDLKSGPYTFASAAGTFQNRFVLRYELSAIKAGVKAPTAVAGAGPAASTESIAIFAHDKNLRIDGGSSVIDAVKVFDLSGRLLTSQSGYNTNEVLIANPNWSSQVLIVQVTALDKSVITKKVVF